MHYFQFGFIFCIHVDESYDLNSIHNYFHCITFVYILVMIVFSMWLVVLGFVWSFAGSHQQTELGPYRVTLSGGIGDIA